MNYKKTLLTTSIITILFGTAQANDYISIISQEKHVYDVVENSLPVATNWIDIGNEFNCVKEFNAYDYPLNESFMQNENCLQKQERTVTTTEVFNGIPRTTVVTDHQNIPVVVSYLDTGLENYNTEVKRTEYTNWIDNGSHYACGDFSPLVSTINLDESFTQNRNCSQDQKRTETVYDIWADNSETFYSTDTEVRTLNENESQPAIGTLNFNTGVQRTEYTNWINNGGLYSCSNFLPEKSTINLGDTFKQNRDCSQDQNRTETVYDIWADGSETLNNTNIELQTLIENEEIDSIGTKNFNTGTQRTEYTEWLDNGSHYGCNTFIPLTTTVNLGSSFTQNRDCSQDQDRTKNIYDIWADNSETLSSTDVETQTLIENEEQISTGTKNFITGEQRTDYTEWLDNGTHYDCGTFAPLIPTIYNETDFTQNRSCSQNQNRTMTIVDLWADGTETINSTSSESQIVSENESQIATGTYLAESCLDILNHSGSNGDGVYEIINNTKSYNVSCNMTIDGGGWTTFGTDTTYNLVNINDGSYDIEILSAEDLINMAYIKNISSENGLDTDWIMNMQADDSINPSSITYKSIDLINETKVEMMNGWNNTVVSIHFNGNFPRVYCSGTEGTDNCGLLNKPEYHQYSENAYITSIKIDPRGVGAYAHLNGWHRNKSTVNGTKLFYMFR